MNKLNQSTINESFLTLSKSELIEISAGDSGVWYNFWYWVGLQVGRATIPDMENYDREAELDALSNYGAPY